MRQKRRLEAFDKSVRNKFNIYNSIFLNLPYSSGNQTGIMIPVLYESCRKGLHEGENPVQILDTFFRDFASITDEQQKIDFMFSVIQYVERQVVLFDSIEDAAFAELRNLGSYHTIVDFVNGAATKPDKEFLREKLSDFSARIVLTAHPTQFYSPAVLDIIGKLRTLIADNNLNEIDLSLQQLGLTSLINSKKPSPLDEAKNIIYFLRNVYYQSVGSLYSYIKENSGQKDFKNYNIIKLGFWPGGDRDGNPFVTAAITRSVIDELRMSLMKCYYQDIKDLQLKLTFKYADELLNGLKDRIYSAMFDPEETISLEEILEPLAQIRALIQSRYHGLYISDLDNFIDKVNLFGLHFATLDIRQDSSVHTRAVENILKSRGYINESLHELSDDQLLRLVLDDSIRINPEDAGDEVAIDTVLNISQLHDLQLRNGEEGCNRYIISNSNDKYSVLFVYALFRWTGRAGLPVNFDIVPLFETMEGMQNAGRTMQELFAVQEYMNHLQHRNTRQTIMLGFSDGTKDGGYLQANWSIFRTKEILTEICAQHNIKPIFFDGRGGPPARGGGKTHRFYAAQSDKIANHEIQLTIQGQTITSTYATHDKFFHNCEQLLAAGLSNSLKRTSHQITAEHRQLIERLAEISYERYAELKAHPKFIPYLEEKSPLRFYDRTNIGSRPGKRGTKKKLELTDLRAIPFVGSWSQLKQNVPGYFGTGTAISKLVEEGKTEELKRLFIEVPFFKALIMNGMMSLSKCNFALTSYLADDAEYGEFWKMLYDEYLLSVRMLLLISNTTELMEEEPVSKASIQIREKIALPLLVIQQYALQKASEETSLKETYEKLVTRTLYGNINAGRNSA